LKKQHWSCRCSIKNMHLCIASTAPTPLTFLLWEGWGIINSWPFLHSSQSRVVRAVGSKLQIKKFLSRCFLLGMTFSCGCRYRDPALQNSSKFCALLASKSTRVSWPLTVMSKIFPFPFVKERARKFVFQSFQS